MELEQVIALLKQKLERLPDLVKLRYDNPEHKAWRYEVLDILRAGFGADSEEYERFKQSGQPKGRSGTEFQLQRWYMSRLGECWAALWSIIKKHEILGEKTVHVESRENRKAELEQFHEGLIRYKQLVVTKQKKGSLLSKQETELGQLGLKLQRLYGTLQNVIEEYGGHAVMFLSGRQYEAFNSAFSYTQFSPEALIVVMDSAIATVNMAIGKLEKALESEQLPQEAVYPGGKPYDAYKDIKGILTMATKKLMIVDPYVDSTLFTMLENVQPGVQIQILSRSMKGDFELAGQKFKTQQGTLEVRKSEKFHDRFILADDKVFHIGASIKDAGTKMCAMNEFEGADIKTTLRKTVSNYWDEAQVVL